MAFIIELILLTRYEFCILTPFTVKFGLMVYLGGLSSTVQVELNHYAGCCSRDTSTSYRIIDDILEIYKTINFKSLEGTDYEAVVFYIDNYNPHIICSNPTSLQTKFHR